MFYFYILRSLKDKKLYLNYTPDLKKRFRRHNEGRNKATKTYIPYESVYYSAFKIKKDELECEKYFKTTSGWKRLKIMLNNTLGNT